MRIAVISDIHSNLYALLRVIEDIDSQNVDTVICLGDLVGYGPQPNEVIAMIKRRSILCIKGNYDASVVDNGFTYIRDTNINSFSLPWTVDELRASNKYYLENLPSSITLNIDNKKVLFVHGSPNRIDEYLYDNNPDLESIVSNIEEDILVCAHTHLPMIKQINDKMIINGGSVGKPKNGSPDSTYAIIDISKGRSVKAEIRKVSYEYKRTMKDMEMKKFPSQLVHSYETGYE
ncbi:metallophosphoesterase family protein [Clostridium manihotivorum]|uniref:Phosphoesterase n=1 Tax=Clostridium manihotivorum TaxID=2320868 RepID=A0A3R5UDE5_9CLOT|nr:metallophosphoesterase family protein [Clostridium manihotivorum]QAA30710.1 YfcE family phosphodiesterase [Clostridium manihotivorum]